MPSTSNSYDSGQSFNSVNIANVTGIRMYAHAYSSSSGGPNNDNRHAYIYQIQAWGIANPYTDIGLHYGNGGDQSIGGQLYSGTPTTLVNNLKIRNTGATFQIPLLSTKTATLLSSFNGIGYQWGTVVSLAPICAGSIQLFTNGGTLIAVDNGSGAWTAQPGFTVSGYIGGYGSGTTGGYGQGLVVANISPSQSSAPYISYIDPQSSDVRTHYNGANYSLPSFSTNLSTNLTQLASNTNTYSGGDGTAPTGSGSISGDFVNTPYGANSPNEIDVYSTHIFTQPYTLTNINFRVVLYYYAYGDNSDNGNFNSEIYYTTNYGSSWIQWWGTSG